MRFRERAATLLVAIVSASVTGFAEEKQLNAEELRKCYAEAGLKEGEDFTVEGSKIYSVEGMSKARARLLYVANAACEAKKNSKG